MHVLFSDVRNCVLDRLDEFVFILMDCRSLPETGMYLDMVSYHWTTSQACLFRFLCVCVSAHTCVRLHIFAQHTEKYSYCEQKRKIHCPTQNQYKNILIVLKCIYLGSVKCHFSDSKCKFRLILQ